MPDGGSTWQLPRLIGLRLADGPTLALGRANALLRRSFTTELEAQLEDESEAIAVAAGSRDGRAGFLAKTPPTFQGS